MLLEGVNSFQGGFAMVVDTLLIVRVSTNQWTKPTSNLGEDLCVGIRHPAEDRSIVLLRLAEESGLLVLGGDLQSNVSFASDISRVKLAMHAKEWSEFEMINKSFRQG